MKLSPMSLLQRIALKTLGLNLDTAKLAKKLSDTAQRFEAALGILGLSKESWLEARKVQASDSKESYAQTVLKIPDREHLNSVLKWLKLSKEDKIEEMIDHVQKVADDGDSPRSFFTGVYTRYLTYKRRNGSKWKDTEAKTYLTKVKAIADKCIVEDTMSLDDFHKICIYTYFYLKLSLSKGQTKHEPKTATLTPFEMRKVA